MAEESVDRYLRGSDEMMAAANTLAGEPSGLTARAFLEVMARSDDLVDHDAESCGMCYQLVLGAEIARKMLASGTFDENAPTVWAEEQQRQWRESKFFRLWQEAVAEGRNPHDAFAERGWEP